MLGITNFSIAQNNRFIDTVYHFQPGEGQNSGQSTEYFPKNIFGPPSKNATETIPESSPSEVLSIGMGGEIIVGFKDSYLVDGPGIDFIIFENVFLNPINQKLFAEPALVSVSEDGIKFIEFPFDSLTLEGCAGTKPTSGKANPFDYPHSGGNGFDIATLGLTKIKYIKIKDITEMILQNTSHPFYDPTLSGFDLDAIAGLYVVDEHTLVSDNQNSTISQCNITAYDYLGNKIVSFENISEPELFQALDKGCYFLVIQSNSVIHYKRICLKN